MNFKDKIALIHQFLSKAQTTLLGCLVMILDRTEVFSSYSDNGVMGEWMIGHIACIKYMRNLYKM
jgi:hypothetical protein